MPKVLEQKLKKEYGAKSSIPYKIMNKLSSGAPKQSKVRTRLNRAAEKNFFSSKSSK